MVLEKSFREEMRQEKKCLLSYESIKKKDLDKCSDLLVSNEEPLRGLKQSNVIMRFRV